MALQTKKKVFVCSECGASYSKWMGKCLQCEALNTVSEQTVSSSVSARGTNLAAASLREILKSNRALSAQSSTENVRLKTGLSFLDRLLGRGLPRGSVILLAGEPGIGKSSLLFQMMAEQKEKTLYVSAEESIVQIAERFGSFKEELSENLLIISESRIAAILDLMESERPQVLVVDSLQMIMAEDDRARGGMALLREVTEALVEKAKRLGTQLWLVGHVNKEGDIAGPKTLEHLVDTVLVFSLAEDSRMRLLQVQKNRFGPAGELVVLEMGERGLSEKSEGEGFWTKTHSSPVSGCAQGAILLGSRVAIVEFQALVVDTFFPSPRRNTSGFDFNRLLLILAVLEKRLKLPFSRSDVYLNVVGGLKIQDPAADLAVAAALVSALTEKAVTESTVFAAEVGLTGELRPVPLSEDRLRFSGNLKRKLFVTSKDSPLREKKDLTRSSEGISAFFASTLEEALKAYL